MIEYCCWCVWVSQTIDGAWRRWLIICRHIITRLIYNSHTVDGRNPAPVDMEKFPLFTWFFIHPWWLVGFLPSTVWNIICIYAHIHLQYHHFWSFLLSKSRGHWFSWPVGAMWVMRKSRRFAPTQRIFKKLGHNEPRIPITTFQMPPFLQSCKALEDYRGYKYLYHHPPPPKII